MKTNTEILCLSAFIFVLGWLWMEWYQPDSSEYLNKHRYESDIFGKNKD